MDNLVRTLRIGLLPYFGYFIFLVLGPFEFESEQTTIFFLEDFAYAASWLSLNFLTLTPKVRNKLIKCLNQLCKFQPIIILETIEYLFDEDRESELILLIQLLQCAPDAYKQIKHVVWDPEILSSYQKAHILLTVEETMMMDEDAWSDTF